VQPGTATMRHLLLGHACRRPTRHRPSPRPGRSAAGWRETRGARPMGAHITRLVSAAITGTKKRRARS